MSLFKCKYPTDLNKQLKNCMKCEILNTCPYVDFSKEPKMKYLPLGKITYSNNSEYIGCFLEISEINYNRLKTLMDNCLIDHNFEKHLNDFSYHLIEEIGEEYNPKRKFLVNKSFTLYVLYTIKKIIEFQLFYDSKYPTQLPVNIYIKEIFKP